MAITQISNSGIKNSDIKEYICGVVDELPVLTAAGSVAYVLEDNKYYMLNSLNEWVEVNFNGKKDDWDYEVTDYTVTKSLDNGILTNLDVNSQDNISKPYHMEMEITNWVKGSTTRIFEMAADTSERGIGALIDYTGPLKLLNGTGRAVDTSIRVGQSDVIKFELNRDSKGYVECYIYVNEVLKYNRNVTYYVVQTPTTVGYSTKRGDKALPQSMHINYFRFKWIKEE